MKATYYCLHSGKDAQSMAQSMQSKALKHHLKKGNTSKINYLQGNKQAQPNKRNITLKDIIERGL